MIKYLRSIPTINRIVRIVLKTIHYNITFLEKKWSIAGVVKINFEETMFLMYSKCDDGIAHQLYYNLPFHESNDLKVFTKFIGENTIVFDIGANTGIYSLVSSQVSKRAIIYSFEPNPINLIRLRNNIKLNSIKNIEVIPKAVGSQNKKINFTIPKNNILSDSSSAVESFSKASYRGEIEWKNIEVDQISIDSFCNENRIENIHLIKIDVEGYELNVLDGAINSIKSHRPLILIESFLDAEKRTYLERFVNDNDYYVYLIFSKGIVKTGKKFEKNVGLNYLLLGYETDNIFTSIDELTAF